MKTKILLAAIILAALPLVSQAYSSSINSCITSNYSNYKTAKAAAWQNYSSQKSADLTAEQQALKSVTNKAARSAITKQYKTQISQAYLSYKTTVKNDYQQYKQLRTNCIENADIKINS